MGREPTGIFLRKNILQLLFTFYVEKMKAIKLYEHLILELTLGPGSVGVSSGLYAGTLWRRECWSIRHIRE